MYIDNYITNYLVEMQVLWNFRSNLFENFFFLEKFFF